MEKETNRRGKYGGQLGAWKKFEARLKHFANKSLENWDQYDFLGYVISKTGLELTPVSLSGADEHYGFSRSTAPSNHPEMRVMGRIIARLHNVGKVPSTKVWNRELIKTYLDFQIKNLRSNQLMTLAYFNNTAAFTKFERAQKNTVQAPTKVDRSSALPENVIAILQQCGIQHVNTLGDLALMHQIEEQDHTSLIPWIELEQFELSKDLMGTVV